MKSKNKLMFLFGKIFLLWLLLAFLGACGVKVERNKKKDSLFKWSGTISYISNFIIPTAHAASYTSICSSVCTSTRCVYLKVLNTSGTEETLCGTNLSGGTYEFEFTDDPANALKNQVVIIHATDLSDSSFVRKKVALITGTAQDTFDINPTTSMTSEARIGDLKKQIDSGVTDLKSVYTQSESIFTSTYVAGALSRLTGDTIAENDTTKIASILSGLSQVEEKFLADYVRKFRETELEKAAYADLTARCSAKNSSFNASMASIPDCYVLDSSVDKSVENADSYILWDPLVQANDALGRNDCIINPSNQAKYSCPGSCSFSGKIYTCTAAVDDWLPNTPNTTGYTRTRDVLRTHLYNHICHTYGLRGFGYYLVDPLSYALKDNKGNLFHIDDESNILQSAMIVLVPGQDPPPRWPINANYNDHNNIFNYGKIYSACKFDSSYRSYCSWFDKDISEAVLNQLISDGNLCI